MEKNKASRDFFVKVCSGIKLARIKRQLKQKELAELIGLNQTEISRIERFSENTKFRSIIDYCLFLDIDLMAINDGLEIMIRLKGN